MRVSRLLIATVAIALLAMVVSCDDATSTVFSENTRDEQGTDRAPEKLDVCPSACTTGTSQGWSDCPPARPKLVVDYSGNNDACCNEAETNCWVAFTECDEGDKCPNNYNWASHAIADEDECLELYDTCPNVEQDCPSGCSPGMVCSYVDLGTTKCKEFDGPSACEVSCSGENVHKRLCFCEGTCGIATEIKLGCGNSF